MCVPLGRLLKLSGPHFLLKIKRNNSTNIIKVIVKIKKSANIY